MLISNTEFSCLLIISSLTSKHKTLFSSPFNKSYCLEGLIHVAYSNVIAEVHHGVDDICIALFQAYKVPEGDLTNGARRVDIGMASLSVSEVLGGE